MVFHNQMTHVFYKCVQLVQGVIILISITIILLFNLKKKHLVRLSVSSELQNQFSLSVYCLLCFVLERKTQKKTLPLTSINFVYMRLPDLRRIARIAMAHYSREAMFEVVQHHYINGNRLQLEQWPFCHTLSLILCK